MYISKDDRAFNVRVNGVDMATEITRDEAAAYLERRRALPPMQRGFVQVYLTARPLEGRKGPHRFQHLPRRPSLRIADKVREKLIAELRADGTMTDLPAPTYRIGMGRAVMQEAYA
jgi:hypothetical protein